MLSEIRWPGRDSLDEGLDVRTLEMDPSGYAAMELLSRPDVMGHLADWRAGEALGMRMKASIMTELGAGGDHGAAGRPHVVRARRRCDGAVLAELLRCTGLAVQPASPVFLYAVDEADLLALSGERYLDEMHQLHAAVQRLLGNRGRGDAPSWCCGCSRRRPPSVHSIRLPLPHVLSRDPGSSEPTVPHSVDNW